jgi:mRNA interferase RelE/StbE
MKKHSCQEVLLKLGQAGVGASGQAKVPAALETHLRHEPENTSRSRIKRLQGLRRPQYRLRVGDIRVARPSMAIVAKSEAESWLAQFGNPE